MSAVENFAFGDVLWPREAKVEGSIPTWGPFSVRSLHVLPVCSFLPLSEQLDCMTAGWQCCRAATLSAGEAAIDKRADGCFQVVPLQRGCHADSTSLQAISLINRQGDFAKILLRIIKVMEKPVNIHENKMLKKNSEHQTGRDSSE